MVIKTLNSVGIFFHSSNMKVEKGQTLLLQKCQEEECPYVDKVGLLVIMFKYLLWIEIVVCYKIWMFGMSSICLAILCHFSLSGEG